MWFKRFWVRRILIRVFCALTSGVWGLAQTASYRLSTHAGGNASADGLRSVARFSAPAGLAADSAGNLYVADSGNHTVRMISADGVVTTLAGYAGEKGIRNGARFGARFSSPARVAVDGDGRVYVSSLIGKVVQRISPEGDVRTLIGPDKLGGTNLYGLAVDSARNLYLALEWPRTVWKRTPSGVITTYAGLDPADGYRPGPAYGAELSQPQTVTVDREDNLYIISGSRIVKISAAQTSTVININGSSLILPPAMAVDATGGIYVAGGATQPKVLKVGTTGATSVFAGSNVPGYRDGPGSDAQFLWPEGLAMGADGSLFVSDLLADVIRKISPEGGVTTFAGIPVRSADGPANSALFRNPRDVATDSAGNLYVADTGNRTIRKIGRDGMVSTIAGLAGAERDAVDGLASDARFSDPVGIAVDGSGVIYVADRWAYTIRKISPDGVVSTLAGLAMNRGAVDGQGAAARFRSPSRIEVDGAGNVYVADGSAVRKVTPDGLVTTLAGSLEQWGSVDGVGATARFLGIRGLTVAVDGTVYVADSNIIRKVTPAGVVTTLAGRAEEVGYNDGLGPAASFVSLEDIAVDATGNLYAPMSSALRKVTPEGMVTTIGKGADYGSYEMGVAIGSAGEIYLVDATQHLVRKLTPVVDFVQVSIQPKNTEVIAGDALSLGATLTGNSMPAMRWWRNGVAVAAGSSATLVVTDFQPEQAGLYVGVGTSGEATARTTAAVVGVSSTTKVTGFGRELTPNDIAHPNGNVFDQVLLTGVAEAITADHAVGQVTRTSFVDLDGDIVQVEFSGPGTLSLVLENSSGPAVAGNYNQAGVNYMKGHAGIVIVGATEKTNVSVFTVGRATAFDPAGAYNILAEPGATNDPAKNGSSLFVGHEGTNYDGIADIAFIAIASGNGKFGGLRTSKCDLLRLERAHRGLRAGRDV